MVRLDVVSVCQEKAERRLPFGFFFGAITKDLNGKQEKTIDHRFFEACNPEKERTEPRVSRRRRATIEEEGARGFSAEKQVPLPPHRHTPLRQQIPLDFSPKIWYHSFAKQKKSF